MSLDTVSIDDAVKLLSLPRVVGTDADGVEITAQNGRYGPYLKKGTDSRSLTSEDQLFTVTLDEALAIYAQPKQRGRAAAAPPLKELGADPVSGAPVVVKSGRFGDYVTDGEYNATLRKDDTVEAITLERAAELLAERREKGPGEEDGQAGGEEGAREEDGREEDHEEDDREEVRFQSADRRSRGRGRESRRGRLKPVRSWPLARTGLDSDRRRLRGLSRGARSTGRASPASSFLARGGLTPTRTTWR